MPNSSAALRQAQAFQLELDDITLAGVEWPGSGDPVVLLHATGFHSRCWDEVVKLLPEQHIYALDLRFHGNSDDAGDVDWGVMANDVCRFIETYKLRNVVAVGHSIGGHLLARAAASHGEYFKQILMIDPVIMSPEVYANYAKVLGSISASDHPVSRRKNNWLDSEQMFQRFKDREPFNSWQQQVLKDYCDYALKPADKEGYRQLACDPLKEASVYVYQDGNEKVHELLADITTPVTLMRAAAGKDGEMDLSLSPTWPELANKLPLCREVYLPEMNHFIPMQDPALVAQYIGEAQLNQWQNEKSGQAL